MDIFTPIQLLGMRVEQSKFSTFFLSMFFPNMIEFGTKEIAFDKVIKNKKLAPFVAPMVAGKPSIQQGFNTMTFRPAYVKPMDVVEPAQNMMRLAGEPLTGTLTMAERRSATVVNLLVEHEEQITRREEVMAAQGVLEGKITVEGEGYPTQEVDFGRRAENTIALLGADKWDAVDVATYDPTNDMEDWAGLSKGIIKPVVFSREAWRLFSKFKSVKDKLDTTKRGETSSLQTGPMTGDVQYRGEFGVFDCWVYNGKYDDADGNEVEIMPGARLLMAPANYQGVRCYGAIQDAKANAEGVVAMSRYPKNWFTDNPSVENLMTQSAPLPVIPDANDFVVITVK